MLETAFVSKAGIAITSTISSNGMDPALVVTSNVCCFEPVIARPLLRTILRATISFKRLKSRSAIHCSSRFCFNKRSSALTTSVPIRPILSVASGIPKRYSTRLFLLQQLRPLGAPTTHPFLVASRSQPLYEKLGSCCVLPYCVVQKDNVGKNLHNIATVRRFAYLCIRLAVLTVSPVCLCLVC
jgi:hypothetical protein